MNVVITGTNSGLGKELANQLSATCNVVALTRQQLDLSNVSAVINYNMPECDILINCAGTGVGGKTDFLNHNSTQIAEILSVNLIAPLLLTQHALNKNKNCKIVNIASTNNKRYYPNDLAYSLSKKGLSEFGKMLTVEYPDVNYLEVQLGLTKTNFNNSRYKHNPERFVDIYQNKHLTTVDAAKTIVQALFDPTIKFIEVSP